MAVQLSKSNNMDGRGEEKKITRAEKSWIISDSCPFDKN